MYGACPPRALPFGFFMLPLRGVRRTKTTNTTENTYSPINHNDFAPSGRCCVWGVSTKGVAIWLFLCCPSGAFAAPKQPTLPKTRTLRLITMILPLRGADVCGHINQGRCHLAFLCCPSGAFAAPQQPTQWETQYIHALKGQNPIA